MEYAWIFNSDLSWLDLYWFGYRTVELSQSRMHKQPCQWKWLACPVIYFHGLTASERSANVLINGRFERLHLYVIQCNTIQFFRKTLVTLLLFFGRLHIPAKGTRNPSNVIAKSANPSKITKYQFAGAVSFSRFRLGLCKVQLAHHRKSGWV